MTRLGLFQGFGVELEYMVVDADSLAVLPVVDRILEAQAGKIVSEVEVGPLAWSNELVLHVVELKTNGPASTLEELDTHFLTHVRRINVILEELDGLLLPTAMHPWMEPHGETVLWPHEYSPVYEAYDRIFGCRGHGWSNLQSTHINLPFGSDEEFGRLHASIRLLLPILPALAASSPLVEGRPTGLRDNRMDFYRSNSSRIPSVAGAVIPEPVFSQAAYEGEIMERMFRDIAPLDPEGILRGEFLNSRGAIPRFQRGSIEIRVLDVQESPAADLAIVTLTAGVLQLLTQGVLSEPGLQMALEVGPLYEVFLDCIRRGEETVIRDSSYLKALGFPEKDGQASEVWWHLLEVWGAAGLKPPPHHESLLKQMLRRGTLSSAILTALGVESDLEPPGAGPLSRDAVEEVYRELAECLQNGDVFFA